MAGTSLADAAVLIPVPPVPGSTFTTILGINDSNTIFGSYQTADGNQHAFFGSMDGNYTTFDKAPTFTTAQAINNAGYIVGITENDGQWAAFERYLDGSVHLLTIEERTMSNAAAYAINAKGQFVGTALTAARAIHSWRRTPSSAAMSSCPGNSVANRAG